MARYTVELNDIVKSGLKIFNFDYNFYDETIKKDFEQKFINHFLFREIGVETVGRFQHYLKCKCDETLPYYNMLFRTALIDYEKTINYKLTETFEKDINKTDNVTGNTTNNGTSSNSLSNNNTLNHTMNGTDTNEKNNSLNSTTNHVESIDGLQQDNTFENGKIDKNTALSIEGKKVGSDTPNGLLSMVDIKNNVYASKADIEDTKNNTIDKQTTEANKTSTKEDNTTTTVNDVVNANSNDSVVGVTNETVTDVNFGTTTNNGSNENTTDLNQLVVGSENEKTKRTTLGSFGVITEADMLKKHIDLQQTLSKIHTMFFDECEDLFMQIF
jgi:hypothetical protein